VRSHGPRRDRHGRGLRGVVIPPNAPAWRSRPEQFDEFIATDIATYRRILGPEVDRIDVGVMDVPEHGPTPWEESIPLARYIPSPRQSQAEGRIIFYRLPLLTAARKAPDARLFLHDVVTQQLAGALGRHPEDIDYLS